jgi:signal transduction histidine kinase
MELVASILVSTTPKQASVPEQAEDFERRPRLVLRFAIYTGVVLLAAGLATLWIVNREVADRATRTIETHARVIAEENLRSHLRASDFVAPVSPARRHELDELLRNGVLIPGVVGARLVNREGRITYAARHQLIGTQVTYPADLREVLAGGFKRRVTRTVTWRGEQNVKVLQALIPVKLSRSAPPLGALELDQDYRAVDVTIGDARTRLALILISALLALYLSLFPILRRITRQLEARNRRLHEHAEERGRLLESERAARAEAESVQRLLSEQNDQLRELDQLKDEFVSLVSHELRTPLTSIRGYLELVLEDGGPLTDEQRRFLGIVDRNSERLLGLVSDLLFLAQIEAGKLAIEVRPVDLDTIVEECIETSSPVAAARSVELAFSTTTVPTLQGDRARLAQVLDNLVSNALKFTPSGGRVEVRLKTVNDRAVLEVEDTGLGIPADEQQQLFERFFRSSRATENAIPGTGLGLTITKAIVERHGGRIELESTENVGTIVRVELPITSDQNLDARARELAA